MAKLKMLGARIGTLNTQRATPLTTETQRITGSRLQKIRDRILRRDNGLCQCPECQAGVPKLATEIDHKIPLWEGPAAGGIEDDSNRWALAAECHLAKSKMEAKRRAGG